MILMSITLCISRRPIKIQVIGTLDSLDIELKGGLSFKAPNVSDITLRTEVITLDSISDWFLMALVLNADKKFEDSTILQGYIPH